MSRADPLEPELLLRAYAMDVFPMADDRDATTIY
jgi:leucyl/phenylalanyl-tRNA---protein transferase